MNKILVTGGAGYIGSHTCKALSAAGMEPVVFDNLVSGHEWAVKWGELEKGDLLDRDRIAEVVRNICPDGVIHFAGSAYIGESFTHPAKYWRNNLTGTINLLDALIPVAVPPVVFSSSCTVYGVVDVDLISEVTPVAPINPYGNTKRAIEIMMEDYQVATGLRHIVLRYFNAGGADAGGDIGEVHDPETHLIPLSIAAAFGDREVLKIFGTDYPTTDGTCVRDYIHVTDLADAHVRALQHLLDGGKSDVFNLGAGEGCSVRDVVDAVGRLVGRPVPVEEDIRRSGDPPRLVADTAHAQDVLGWKPVHSSLDNIVTTAWHWYRAQKQILSQPDAGLD
ncbi:MAG: UDP-glucose 4-epimerase GalE [Pelagibacteraceae bacterium]|nr:UDP-glucose 4-epimerase GalE [Pelagibacteraceae bacterium]PPR10879.1 MAG: UDP-glucose 4-epimerase [Alphaproteobacteria bacterium MarineAlpha11_Bin1]|tara:strand:- start:15364 stop:16371 length:1008 start_codon:yes stop_codon:yes gene_type:complete